MRTIVEMLESGSVAGRMSFGTRCLFGIVSILVLSACGTTSDVRPSRYAMLFDTLEVPPLKVEAQTPPSDAFLEQLQQAFVQQIRNQNLFANVVTKAEPRVLGGVLTLNATILSWDEQPEEGAIEIRLGIEDMGSSCELTHATTKGALKRTGNADSGTPTEQYEIQPLVEGAAAFVNDFMHPNPYEL